MGLTNSSTGGSILKNGGKTKIYDKTVVLAGSPNVGKSTVFNALTGLNQHTGNWAGKTVSLSEGIYKGKKGTYRIVDLPGTYSLFSGSEEQDLARDHICFGDYDILVAVCDATALERNLILALQITEATDKVVLCINLMDEADKKGIDVDLDALEGILGIPVVGISANNRATMAPLEDIIEKNEPVSQKKRALAYPDIIVKACNILSKGLPLAEASSSLGNFIALRLLCGEKSFERALTEHLGKDILTLTEYREAYKEAAEFLSQNGINSCIELHDLVLEALVRSAEDISKKAVKYKKSRVYHRDRKLDDIFTGKKQGFSAMLLLLCILFFITVWGANYISDVLFFVFGKGQEFLEYALGAIGVGNRLLSLIVNGIYGTTSTVVSVMLPPMAIFFPLFTILEDSGYLPRIAYNLDKPFKKNGSCGKMALTMCMGLGCNAAGVVGCRIIDNRKEKLISTVTNSFIPCNGKFSGLITVITLFIVTGKGFFSKAGAAGIILLLIILSALLSLLVSRILGATLLRTEPSHFVLELPSYRKPRFIRVIVRSMLDRTVFVLGRAVCVAIPAGAIIWFMTNININGLSLLEHMRGYLEGIGGFMGLDGMILTAFILGFPANEIVIPLLIMGYSTQGIMSFEAGSEGIYALFTENGWGIKTAICFLIFSVFHAPCSTTLLTVKKETGSIFWTFVSAILPTVIGFILCVGINYVFDIFS